MNKIFFDILDLFFYVRSLWLHVILAKLQKKTHSKDVLPVYESDKGQFNKFFRYIIAILSKKLLFRLLYVIF